MKGYLANLRPFEKRLVVGVGVVLFIVLNLWFVVPHFSDWGKVQVRMTKARGTVDTFNREIAQKSFYEREIKKLESEGLAVPPEDQAHHFQSAVQSQAAQSAVPIQNSGRINTRTNQFFIEQMQTIQVQCKEQPLVDFLYQLGSGNSLIRVRDLTLRPDPSQQQLSANIKLVASYQKKTATKARPVTKTAAK
jgi:type II secretory pathway component PulM